MSNVVATTAPELTLDRLANKDAHPSIPVTSPILRLESITLSFGGVTAVADFDLAVDSGEIRAIIGPNGAGKSSLLNVINSPSGVIDAPSLTIFGLSFDSSIGRYLFALTIVVTLTGVAQRLVNTQTGHNFIAVRDNELAAKVIGVPVLRTKLLAFAISSFIVGVAGALWAFAYLRTVEPAGFNH